MSRLLWPRPGTPVVVAFDGSDKGDSTALVGCTIEPRPHLFVVDAWERPLDAPGNWRVPRSEVRARVTQCMDRFEVLASNGGPPRPPLAVIELAPDPPGWRTEIEEWEEAWDDRVVRFETNQRKGMAAACDRFYTAVTTRGLTHDGDPRLARHVRNARPKETPAGTYIIKDGPTSPRKIDLAVAAVVAHERSWWRREGAPESAADAYLAALAWTCACGHINPNAADSCGACHEAKPE